MAGINPALLSAQLNTLLHNEEESLEKRLKLAESTFTSSSFHVVDKDDIVLQWLVEFTLQGADETDTYLAFSSLFNCISSGKFLSNTSLRSSTIQKLISAFQVLPQFFCKNIRKVGKNCIFTALQSPHIKKWLTREPHSLCVMVRNFLVCTVSEVDTNDCLKMVDELLQLYKMCLMKKDLRVSFINLLMVPLAETLIVTNNNLGSELGKKILNCYNAILVHDPQFVTKCVDAYLDKSEEEDEAFALLKLLKSLPSENNELVVSSVYSSLLHSCINKCSDHVVIINLLCCLSYYIGVTVKPGNSVKFRPIMNWTQDQTFEVLKEFIKVLQLNNFPLDSEGPVTITSWCTVLFTGSTVIAGCEETVRLQFFSLMLDYNPLIIDYIQRSMVILSLSQKSENVRTEFANLLKAVFNSAVTTQRLLKFITKYFQHFSVSVVSEYDVRSLSKEDVFPSEVGDSLAKAVSMLPSSHIPSVFSVLQSALQENCYRLLESCGPRPQVVVLFEHVAEWLAQFFSGVKIAECSVPDPIKNKFNEMIEDMAMVFSNFGHQLLSCDHHDRMLASYLRISHLFGNLVMVLMEYEGARLKPISQQDLIETNFGYLHPYLTPSEWSMVSKRALSSSCTEVRELYYLLIVQKMAAVAQVEEGADCPSARAARHLFDVAPPSWIWDNADKIIPRVDSNELMQAISIMTRHAGLDATKWTNLLHSEHFHSPRVLVGTGLGLLKAVAYHVKKNKKASNLCYTVMLEIPIEQVVEYELSTLLSGCDELDKEMVKLKEAVVLIIQTAIDEPQPNPVMEELSVSKFFELILKFPLHEFSKNVSFLFGMVAIAFLYDFAPNSTNDVHLFNIIHAVTEANTPSSDTEGLWALSDFYTNIVLKFLLERSSLYPKQRELFRIIIRSLVSPRSLEKKLYRFSSDIDPDNLWVTSMTLEELTKAWKDENSKDDGDGAKIKHAAMQFLRTETHFFNSIKSSPERKYLYDFTQVLRCAIALDSDKCLNLLQDSVYDYINFALEDYEHGSQLLKVIAKHKNSIEFKFQDLENSFSLKVWDKVLESIKTIKFDQVIAVDDVDLEGKKKKRKSRKPESSWSIASWLFLCESPTCGRLMLQKLLTLTVEVIDSEPINEYTLKNTFAIWNQLITTFSSYDKSQIFESAVESLFWPILALVKKHWENDKVNQFMVIPVFEIFVQLLNNRSIHLNPGVVDGILELINTVPTSNVALLNAALETNCAMYVCRTSIANERLPVLLIGFKRIFAAVAAMSSPSLMMYSEELEALHGCSAALWKEANFMMRKKKDFVNIAPYIAADLLQIYSKQPIHSSVKENLDGVLFEFYSACDEYGLSQMTTFLSEELGELYKSTYKRFQKTAKFRGKV